MQQLWIQVPFALPVTFALYQTSVSSSQDKKYISCQTLDMDRPESVEKNEPLKSNLLHASSAVSLRSKEEIQSHYEYASDTGTDTEISLDSEV